MPNERNLYRVTITESYLVNAEDKEDAMMEVRLAKRNDEVVLKGMPYDDDDIRYDGGEKTATPVGW